jgi:hypothetical protein
MQEQIDAVTKQINTVTNNGGLVDRRVAAAEGRLQLQIRTSLDALPQRLLSNEAKKAIQDAIMTDVKATLDQMRQEFQINIELIKEDIEKLQKGQ